MSVPKPAAFAAFAAFAAAPVQAQTVYNQPAAFPGGAYASQNDTNAGGLGNFATVYDDFTLASTAAVTGATWQGEYVSSSPGAISAFTLTFYSDSAGQPGAALAMEVIPGTANETFVRLNAFGLPLDNYSASFAAPFTATAGTTYWLSIVPDLDDPPQWAWDKGTGGNGIAYQDFFGTRYRAYDMAFSLTGSPVPEASTTASFGLLLALGFGGLVVAAKRKKASSAL